MSKLLQGITVVFLFFILWIIYSADTGKHNVFFYLTDKIPYGDKLGHFFLFGILALLLNIALRFKRFKLWQKLPLGTVLVSLFVILEELSQAFFPNRTLDITDLLADGLGILVFSGISYLLFDHRSLGLEKSN